MNASKRAHRAQQRTGGSAGKRAIRIGFTAALCNASFALATSLADPSAYNIEEVVNLGGPDSRAYAINNAGTVVGYSMPQDCCAHAFQYPAAPTFYPATSYAHGINQAGDVIGDIDASGGGGCYHAAKLFPNYQDFDAAEKIHCSNGIAINASGDVLAQRYGPQVQDPQRAIKSAAGNWLELEIPSQPPGYGPGSHAGGINDFGEVVGYLDPGAPSPDRWRPGEAFYWDQSLGAVNLNLNVTYPPRHLPFEIRTAAAINNHHRIVGFSGIELAGGVVHAYALDRTFYDASTKTLKHKFVDLGTFPDGGGISYALGLNSSNDAVVGAAYRDASGAGNYLATLFTHQRVIDLNTKVSRFDAMHWTLMEATGINDHGVITGWGVHDGVTRAFILKPHAHIELQGETMPNGALLKIQGSGFNNRAPVTLEIRDLDIGGPLAWPTQVVTADAQGKFSVTINAGPCSRILAVNAWDHVTSAYSNMVQFIVPCLH